MKLFIIVFLIAYFLVGSGETRARASNFCTGNFKEKSPSDAGNGLQRPDAGTPCIKDCVYISPGSSPERWGESYCYTDKVQWGAECLWCDDLCETDGDCQTDDDEEVCNKIGNAKKGVCGPE